VLYKSTFTLHLHLHHNQSYPTTT